MKARVLTAVRSLSVTDAPLDPADMPIPVPGYGEVLLRVRACGVCHTELDEIEGRTPPPFFPVIPGHQVVGKVADRGPGATRFSGGERVGVGWIHSSCGACTFCRSGLDNLCPSFMATGRDVHGGYAQYMTVHEDYAFPIPGIFSDSQAAPLLCAGAIGYRSLRLSGMEDGRNLGLTGVGASAHLVLMMVRHRFPRANVFVFARSPREREFALGLGAAWAGDTGERPPVKLHAVIDTTPAWRPVVEALACLDAGGRLVVNAIRKEDIDKDELLRLEYPAHLWMEKEIRSVANVARADIAEFLELAAEIPILPEVQEYPLEDANRALMELKQRRIRGAKVLIVD